MSSSAPPVPLDEGAPELEIVDERYIVRYPPRVGGPEGLQWHNLIYPAYFRRKPRQRTLAFMTVSRKRGTVQLTDEYGTVSAFGLDASGYTALRAAACAARLTVFAPLGSHPSCYPWIMNDLEDTRHARILCSGRGVVSGVHWQLGNRHAAVVSPESWGFSDLGLDWIGFLPAVRQAQSLGGVGTYDTSASWGEALLHRYWRAHNVPRVWRLPRQLVQWFTQHTNCGGRTITPAVGGRFGELWEADLRRAYPRQLANGVPWGRPVLLWRGCDGLHEGVTSHGLWRVTVHDEILRGPVGIGNGRYGSRVEWDLQPGEYELTLWKEQVIALLETGRASVEWLYGYCWDEFSTALAGYVEEMEGYREQADADNNSAVSHMVKRAVNGAIGRFGMVGNFDVVPEADATPGDRLFVLPVWCASCDNPLDSPMAALRESESERCTPLHWLSYIRVMTGLAIYRVQREEEQRGNSVVLENVDCLYFTKLPLACDDTHRWRLVRLDRCWLPYHRGVVYQVSGRLVMKLPGAARRNRGTWVAAYIAKGSGP